MCIIFATLTWPENPVDAHLGGPKFQVIFSLGDMPPMSACVSECDYAYTIVACACVRAFFFFFFFSMKVYAE